MVSFTSSGELECLVHHLVIDRPTAAIERSASWPEHKMIVLPILRQKMRIGFSSSRRIMAGKRIAAAHIHVGSDEAEHAMENQVIPRQR